MTSEKKRRKSQAEEFLPADQGITGRTDKMGVEKRRQGQEKKKKINGLPSQRKG